MERFGHPVRFHNPMILLTEQAHEPLNQEWVTHRFRQSLKDHDTASTLQVDCDRRIGRQILCRL